MPGNAKLVYWTICEGTIGQEVLNIQDFSEHPGLKGFPRVSGQWEEPTKAKGGRKHTAIGPALHLWLAWRRRDSVLPSRGLLFWNNRSGKRVLTAPIAFAW
jgi:hypothetical protein